MGDEEDWVGWEGQSVASIATTKKFVCLWPRTINGPTLIVTINAAACDDDYYICKHAGSLATKKLKVNWIVRH